MDKSDLDNQIIDWSLKMVQKKNLFTDINSGSAVLAVYYDLLSLACAQRNYRNYIILSALFGSDDWYVDWDRFEHAQWGPGHENMVVYGLMLYALKRTGYKVKKRTGYKADIDDLKPLAPLVLALMHGGDFPDIPFDYKDMPLEFSIEAVKASVPES